MSRVFAIALVVASTIVAGAPWVGAQGAPPAAGTGTIAGTVIDKATADPLIDAGVEIVEIKKTVRTDLDGKYTVKVPPGTYSVRFFAALYQGARVTGVTVVANQVARADAALQPEGEAAVEIVEVVAEAAKAAEATQLVRRKKASVVSDTVAAEMIAKAPDSSVAEVVERIPAVVISSDNRPFIRGLPDRYSFALLNGSRLPSTDPDSRTISLDLFPADFLDSINVMKSYTPDLPGDFAGGLIDVELKDFPETLTYSIGLGIGGNTETTFQDFSTYEGCGGDYFGFGGCRDLPGIFGDGILANKRPPDAQQRALVGALDNIWTPTTETAPPSWGIDFSVGNTIGPLGFTLGGIYDNSYQQRRGEQLNNYQNENRSQTDGEDGSDGATAIRLRDGSTYDHGEFSTTLGGFGSLGYRLAANHKLTLRGLVNRSSSDDTYQGTGGFSESQQEQNIFQNLLQYEQEQLGFGQLGGEHKWDWMDVEWRSALSQTTQDIPDARFVRYSQGVEQPVRLLDPKQPSLQRVYQDLEEWMTDSRVDATVPFHTRLPFTDVWSGLPAKLKAGVAYSYRARDYSQRRFQYEFPNSGADLSQTPEVVLRTPFIGNNRNNGQFQFFESTLGRDTFDANQEIAGAYGMLDLPIIEDRLRLVGGARVEYSYIRTNGTDLENQPFTTTLNDLDPIPGVSLIYSPRDDMNVRYGFSQTVSRPDFFELNPSELPAPLGGRSLRGNPNLVSGSIASHDLRWEWFFSPAELVSVGFFYKDFTDPIEKIAISSTSESIDSFTNANSATNYGFEFELRKNLGFLAPEPSGSWSGFLNEELRFVNFTTNVSWIESEVDVSREFTREQCLEFVNQGQPVPQDCTRAELNANRPLQGQPPFIVNAILEYDNPDLFTVRLLYNTIGNYITAAGVDRLPDILVERRDRVDAVFIKKIDVFGTPIKLKAAVENLLDQNYEETQSGLITQQYNNGVAFSLGVSYSF